ncbi:MAG: hypothetical protein IJ744_05290 [Lachnospiraceae bacterium]|nr:hypothetical protein [Lachnospiraceae bacterium]
MYCVKCGVKLQEGVEKCPLCQTPVWNPEAKQEEKRYSDIFPNHHSESTLPAAIGMTIICVIAIVVILTVCLKLYSGLGWGGYAVFGILLFYVLFVLPLWFSHPKVEVFVPADHAAILLYLLYICLKTGGHWFLSFAFPVVLANCLLLTALICLLKYIRGGKIFICGGFLVLLGGFTMLVEFFEHISFGTKMFQWSLYSCSSFVAVGLCMLVAGSIPRVRQMIRKKFFF